jgi:hypothetical protein
MADRLLAPYVYDVEVAARHLDEIKERRGILIRDRVEIDDAEDEILEKAKQKLKHARDVLMAMEKTLSVDQATDLLMQISIGNSGRPLNSGNQDVTFNMTKRMVQLDERERIAFINLPSLWAPSNSDVHHDSDMRDLIRNDIITETALKIESKIPPVSPTLESIAKANGGMLGRFNPAYSIDLRDLVVQKGHCHPVVRVTAPSKWGCTRSIVECAPDVREVVIAFYYRLVRAVVYDKCDIRVLFAQSTVDLVVKIKNGVELPWKDLESVEDVSRRVYHYINNLKRTQVESLTIAIFSTPPRDSKYTRLIRLYAALVLGYGITQLVPIPSDTNWHVSESGAIAIPGLQQHSPVPRRVPPTPDSLDALRDVFVFTHLCIPPCRVFPDKHDFGGRPSTGVTSLSAFESYFDGVIVLEHFRQQTSSNSSSSILLRRPGVMTIGTETGAENGPGVYWNRTLDDAGIQEMHRHEKELHRLARTINAWTDKVIIRNVSPLWVSRIMRIAAMRCIGIDNVIVESSLITCVPIIAPLLYSTATLYMDRNCPHVIVGCYYLPTMRAANRTIVRAPPCPIKYNVSGPDDDVCTGARLRANSIKVLDLSTPRVEHLSNAPIFQRDKLRFIAYIANKHVHQALINDHIIDRITNKKEPLLLTYYNDMTYLRHVFVPCDFSPHAETEFYDHMTHARQGHTNDILGRRHYAGSQRHAAELDAMNDDPGAGFTRCASCTSKLREITGIHMANLYREFPFCMASCSQWDDPVTAKVQLNCETPFFEDQPAVRRCSGCCGRHESYAPRVIISVDPRDEPSVRFLLSLVTVLREMMCEALVIVKIAPNVPVLGNGDVDRKWLRAIVAHITDNIHYSRVRIVVATPERSAETIALDVSDEYHIINYGSHTEPRDWIQYRPIEIDTLHAFILSVVIQLRDQIPAVQTTTSAIFELVKLVKRVNIDPSYVKYEDIRAILVYFDRIGLIKYNIHTNSFFANVPQFHRENHTIFPSVRGTAYVALHNMIDSNLHFEERLYTTDPNVEQPLDPMLLDDFAPPFDIYEHMEAAYETNRSAAAEFYDKI